MTGGFKINLLPPADQGDQLDKIRVLAADKDRISLAYKLLLVTPADSEKKVKKRYRKLVKLLNPNKLSRDPATQAQAIEKLEILDEVFSMIINDMHRRKNRYNLYYGVKSEKSSTAGGSSHFFTGILLGIILSFFSLFFCFLSGLFQTKSVFNLPISIYILMGTFIISAGILNARFKKVSWGG